jgi:hypothetical protein
MSLSIRRSRFVVVVLTTGAMVFTSTAAQAERDQASAKAAAKTVLARGSRDLESRLYGRALAEFHEAYRIFPSPKIFFNIGLANLYLGRNGEAVQAFETFLAEPTGAPEESVARARTESAALRPKVAAVTVACPQVGVELVIDGRPAGKTPLPGPLYLDPGQHQLQAKPHDGAPLVRDFVVDAGTRPTLDLPGGPPAGVAPAHKSVTSPAGPPPARPAPVPAPATRPMPPTSQFAGTGGAKGPARQGPASISAPSAPAGVPIRPTVVPAPRW